MLSISQYILIKSYCILRTNIMLNDSCLLISLEENQVLDTFFPLKLLSIHFSIHDISVHICLHFLGLQPTETFLLQILSKWLKILLSFNVRDILHENVMGCSEPDRGPDRLLLLHVPGLNWFSLFISLRNPSKPTAMINSIF